MKKIIAPAIIGLSVICTTPVFGATVTTNSGAQKVSDTTYNATQNAFNKAKTDAKNTLNTAKTNLDKAKAKETEIKNQISELEKKISDTKKLISEIETLTKNKDTTAKAQTNAQNTYNTVKNDSDRLANLKSELEALEKDVADKKSTKTTLENKVEALQNEISTLNTTIADLEKKTATPVTQADVDALKTIEDEKKVVYDDDTARLKKYEDRIPELQATKAEVEKELENKKKQRDESQTQINTLKLQLDETKVNNAYIEYQNRQNWVNGIGLENTSEYATLTSVQAQVTAKQNAVTAKEKEVTNAQTTVNTKKAAYDTKQAQFDEGSFGFFTWVKNNNSNSEYRADAQEALTALTTAKYASDTHKGDPLDATNLDSMKSTFEYIKASNYLRKNDENFQGGRQELNVSSYLMATAQSNANRAGVVYATSEETEHPKQFSVGENLAWGYDPLPWGFEYTMFGWDNYNTAECGPFAGWYTKEKDMYYLGETASRAKYKNYAIGHYENIIEKVYDVTGFAIHTDIFYPGGNLTEEQREQWKTVTYTYCQDYQNKYDDEWQGIPLNEYELMFNTYYASVDPSAEKQALETAQNTLKIKQNQLNTLKNELNTLKANLTKAQTAFDDLKSTSKLQAAKTTYETLLSEQNNIKSQISELENFITQLYIPYKEAELENINQQLNVNLPNYIKSAKERIKVSKAEYESALNARQKKEEELSEYNKNKAALETARTNLTKKNNELKNKQTELNNANNALTVSNNTLNTFKSNNKTDIDRFSTIAQELSDATTALNNAKSAATTAKNKYDTFVATNGDKNTLSSQLSVDENALSKLDPATAGVNAAQNTYNKANANYTTINSVTLANAILKPITDSTYSYLNDYVTTMLDSKVGWKTENGKLRYYEESDGKYVTGWQTIEENGNSFRCLFDNNGYLDSIPTTNVKLNKTTISLTIGENSTLTASLEPTNATNKNLVWSSSNTKIATVDNTGKIKAVGVGTTDITVKTADTGKTATCKLTVNPISVTGVKLNKTTLSIEKGKEQKLTVTISPDNATNKEIVWSSSNNKVVTVDNTGNVKAINTGTADITVKTKDGGKTAICKVEVIIKEIPATAISLNKKTLILTEGNSEKITSTISPNNVTNQTITWNSDNTSIVTVDNAGNVKAIKSGTANITAKTNNGKIAICKVMVKAKSVAVTGVNLNKSNTTIIEGKSEKLISNIIPSNATQKDVIWSSSNTKIATVDNNGNVNALSPGTTNITAKTHNGKTAICKVTVKAKNIAVTGISLNKTATTITKGGSEKIVSNITPSNAIQKGVTWSSSNTKIATVDSNGAINAISPGTANITVKTKDGNKTATCKVTVIEKNIPVTKIVISKTTLAMVIGENQTLQTTITPENATNKTITWNSNNTKVVTVSNGVIKAIGKGTATITAKSGDKNATCVVSVKDVPEKTQKNGWKAEDGGFRYYKDGKMYTGWHYMSASENETTPHWSYFGRNGLIYTGWRNMGANEGEKTKHISYFGSNGWLRTGWVKLGKGTNEPDGNSTPHWSYFGGNGWLRTGWQEIGKGTNNPDGNNPKHISYFGSNGWLRTGMQDMGKGTNNPDGNAARHKSYFGNNGWLVTNRQFSVAGKKYIADNRGWLK